MTLPKSLAAIVALVLLVMGVFAHFSSKTTATLTFTGDKVLFEDQGIKIEYFLPQTLVVGGEVMPGWKARNFEKKVMTKDDQEADVSELTLERVSVPDRVMVLVIGKPLPVAPVMEEEGRIWEPAW